MALRIYLTGHRSFANHGCEALVRSAVSLFRTAFGEATFLVPSADPAEDGRFWPEAAAAGVRFVPVVEPWAGHRWWERAAKRVPGWKHLPWPPAPLAPGTRAALEDTDLLISTGGDNYALEYGLLSLQTMMAVDGAAMDRGIPAVLWGASVGPFEAAPEIVPAVRRHLGRFDSIVARETLTHGYLRGLGLDARLSLSVDPAFLMMPEPIDVKGFWPAEGGKGTVAVNLSPIILRYHAASGGGTSLEDEVAGFLNDLAADGYGVLLLPHVVGQSGSPVRCDHACLSKVLERSGSVGGRITLAPRHLNAPQLKFVLSRCRFMIGGRTHATIGALSSGVPTVSIAYSVKAKGINRDLFGDTRYVIDGAEVGRAALHGMLDRLRAEETEIRRTLAARKAEWPGTIERALARLRPAVERRGRAAATRPVTAA